MRNTSFKAQTPIDFYHPQAFWIGTGAVIAGVLAHIPMFIDSAAMNYAMVDMQMSNLMMIGMYAIVAGTLLAGYGLYPPGRLAREYSHQAQAKYGHVHAKAMDEAKLTPTHYRLILVLLIALIVDVMKPATLGFVMPGTLQEYGLTKSGVALLPLAGLSGTAIGSMLWGYLGDVIGRRASILLAAIIFIGTSICGAMPSYAWNIFMCFAMGLGAGGMLPITFALLAEVVPAKQRGWLVVLLGGIGTLGGYLAASGFAALLEPVFGWRILWFLGMPTGIILILLNRYIPESPRYLMVHGKQEEAERVMRSFGVELIEDETSETAPDPDLATQDALAPTVHRPSHIKPGSFRTLFRPPFVGLTWGLGLYGFAWGLVNFGFLLWLPTNLREMGMSLHASDAILAKSAIIAFPSTILVAWLYHTWSTKGTMILFAVSHRHGAGRICRAQRRNYRQLLAAGDIAGGPAG